MTNFYSLSIEHECTNSILFSHKRSMMKKITLHPSRIGCPSIPGTMKGILHSLDGVEEVNVRYDDRSLDITFDDAKTSEAAIIKKIGEEMGLAMEVADTHGARKEGGAAETCPM